MLDRRSLRLSPSTAGQFGGNACSAASAPPELRAVVLAVCDRMELAPADTSSVAGGDETGSVAGAEEGATGSGALAFTAGGLCAWTGNAVHGSGGGGGLAFPATGVWRLSGTITATCVGAVPAGESWRWAGGAFPRGGLAIGTSFMLGVRTRPAGGALAVDLGTEMTVGGAWTVGLTSSASRLIWVSALDPARVIAAATSSAGSC